MGVKCSVSLNIWISILVQDHTGTISSKYNLTLPVRTFPSISIIIKFSQYSRNTLWVVNNNTKFVASIVTEYGGLTPNDLKSFLKACEPRLSFLKILKFVNWKQFYFSPCKASLCHLCSPLPLKYSQSRQTIILWSSFHWRNFDAAQKWPNYCYHNPSCQSCSLCRMYSIFPLRYKSFCPVNEYCHNYFTVIFILILFLNQT